MKKFIVLLAILATVSCAPKISSVPVSFAETETDGLLMFYKGRNLIGTEYFRNQEEMRVKAAEWGVLGPLLTDDGARIVQERGKE